MNKLSDLDRRYDGPIPQFHSETEETARRRDRGTLAVFERQVVEFLDAATRTEMDIDDIEFRQEGAADYKERLASKHITLKAHLECACEAMRNVALLRAKLKMAPHPLMVVARDLLRGGIL